MRTTLFTPSRPHARVSIVALIFALVVLLTACETNTPTPTPPSNSPATPTSSEASPGAESTPTSLPGTANLPTSTAALPGASPTDAAATTSPFDPTAGPTSEAVFTQSVEGTVRAPDLTQLPTATEYVPPTTTPASPIEEPTAPLPTPPVAESLDPQEQKPNAAWGEESDQSLSIVVARYIEFPVPAMQGWRTVVRWDYPLELLDLSVSPDQRWLAALTKERQTEEEGITPTWLYVIDLSTNEIRSLPDYRAKPDLYEYQYFRPMERILGWTDNGTIAVQQSTTGKDGVVIASIEGSSYERLPFPPDEASAPATAYSPVRNLFFSEVIGTDSLPSGYWIYNADGSNPTLVLETNEARPVYVPDWSPDGNFISFVSPRIEPSGLTDYAFANIWLFNPESKSLRAISEEEKVWDTIPTWSSDGQQLAFVRLERPAGDRLNYGYPADVETTVYVANTDNFQPEQVPALRDARNDSLQWSPNSDLVATSSAGDPEGLTRLVAVPRPSGGFSDKFERLFKELRQTRQVRALLFPRQ
jgi:WD40 repeat protein